MQRESSPDPLREPCSGVEERLSLYVLDNGDELESDERGRIEEHIASCDACRQDVDVLRATAALVRDLPANGERLDGARRDSLLAAADEPSGEERVVRRASFFASRRALVGAAAAVIVGALVWARLQLQEEDTTTASQVDDGLLSAPPLAKLESERLVAGEFKVSPLSRVAPAAPDGKSPETALEFKLEAETPMMGIAEYGTRAVNSIVVTHSDGPPLVPYSASFDWAGPGRAADDKSRSYDREAKQPRVHEPFSGLEGLTVATMSPSEEKEADDGKSGGKPAGPGSRPQSRQKAKGKKGATSSSRPGDPAEGKQEDRERQSRVSGDRQDGEPVGKKAQRGPTIAQRVDTFLSLLDRRAGEAPSAMFYRYWGDNSFVETARHALSTFAVDVDTASYTLTRKHLYDRGTLPPAKAVRTEELVNYFPAGYEPPKDGEGAFSIHTEVVPSPFAHEPEYKLLRVGIKAREVKREQRKACSLVFVVDTSGSMRRGDRLELVKDALGLLVDQLDEGDTIGIVAFDTTSRVILEPTSGSEKERIVDGINSLFPDHSTNLDSGMTLGYQMADRAFREAASNRVILLSDGVANTGATDQRSILDNVRAEREKGIYLTTVGVGMDNHNDTLLEQLADSGNGHCVYVDRIAEARKVFVENLTGTLQTIAKDAKIQVEFDKKQVLRYRQLGYENRVLAGRDFRDNSVDAGEVGAGHEITALYEIKLHPRDDAAGVAGRVDPLATVRVRYLTVDHGEAVELEKKVELANVRGSFADATPSFQLSTHVAEFAEILRESYWARGSDLARVADGVQALLTSKKIEPSDDVTELVALMKRADALVKQRQSSRNEVAMVVDALKENRYLRTQIEEVRGRRVEDTRRYLDELKTQNSELRRRLEDLLKP